MAWSEGLIGQDHTHAVDRVPRESGGLGCWSAAAEPWACSRRAPVSREIHCPMGDGHLEADDDAQLLEKVRAHAAEAHPELTEEQIQQVMAQGAHDSH